MPRRLGADARAARGRAGRDAPRPRHRHARRWQRRGSPPEAPDIAIFAAAHLAALDALGIGCLDLDRTHTGTAIAAEIAIAAPTRVRRLILDGSSLDSEEQRGEYLARYAPVMRLDMHGAQLLSAWHFVRGTVLFRPWYRTDGAVHRRPGVLPPAAALHAKASCPRPTT